MTDQTTQPEELDTRLVECPNGCEIEPHQIEETSQMPRQFRYVTGEVGTRNYCKWCGAKMRIVDGDTDD